VMEFILVTGMSGAGKSRAINALEDIGFYCVDNMPPKLIPKFAELCLQTGDTLSRVAVVADVRGGALFGDLFEAMSVAKSFGVKHKILFLDCDDTTLARRYKETRRQHPLVTDEVQTVSKAISAEREILKPLYDNTDYLIDTTLLSTSQLKARISTLFLDEPMDSMPVQCMSFGFKYGYPSEADLMFDVRFLPNPFYVPALRNKTGLDDEVRQYVMDNDMTKELERRLYDLIDYLLPLYRNEGKSQIVIAIGCTGGKHRSVVLTEQLAAHVAVAGARTIINHRDIEKL